MGEPEELVEGVGEINLAGGGFWKTWSEVEEKAPTEMKNPRLVRFRVINYLFAHKSAVEKVAKAMISNEMVLLCFSFFFVVSLRNAPVLLGQSSQPVGRVLRLGIIKCPLHQPPSRTLTSRCRVLELACCSGLGSDWLRHGETPCHPDSKCRARDHAIARKLVVVSVTWEDPELLVTVSSLQRSAGSKVGEAKLSGALAWLAFGLAACSQRLYCNRQLPAPVTAAMLGLAQGVVAQSEADCRYIVQVTFPQPCGLPRDCGQPFKLSLAARFFLCQPHRFCQPDAVDQPVARVCKRDQQYLRIAFGKHQLDVLGQPVARVCKRYQQYLQSLGVANHFGQQQQQQQPDTLYLRNIFYFPNILYFSNTILQCFTQQSSDPSVSASVSVSATTSHSPSSTTSVSASATSHSPSSTTSVSASASVSATTSPSPSSTISVSVSVTISPSCSPSPKFVTRWNFSVGEILNFPLAATGTYDFEVDWGHGVSSSCRNSSCSHQYSQTSLYNVSIVGLLHGFSFIHTWTTMARKLVDVLIGGGVCLGDGGWQFYRVTIARWTALDAPCTAQVTNMSYMFSEASNFNQNLNGWDTSSVTNMRGMFYRAFYFNQSLSSWDTSSVKDMNRMFRNAFFFNQDVSSWDTSSVTNMDFLSETAANFNQDLSGWNTSSVTTMQYIFKQLGYLFGDQHGWHVWGHFQLQPRLERLGHLFGDQHEFHVFVRLRLQAKLEQLGHLFGEFLQ
eukprot:g27232.t1